MREVAVAAPASVRRAALRPSRMGIGTSIFLIAVGAILRYAVTVTVQGVELQTVGLILMIVGIIGLVISLAVIFMASDERPRRPDDYPTRRL
jgi:sulfite exporter TauE/SafE